MKQNYNKILISDTCGICKGSGCEKLCYGRVGISLLNFLSNFIITETNIGEYEYSGISDKVDLIVSGHMLYNDMTTGKILSQIGIPIEKPNRIKDYDNNSPIKIIKSIKNINKNISDDDINEAISEIKDINAGKIMGVPLIPGQIYTIKINKENRKGKLISILWAIDKVTHRITCTFNLEDTEDKTIIKLNNEDYMIKIIPENIGIVDKQNIIKLTPYGMIKPICIKNKNNVMCAVDCTYIYFISNNYVRIIGYWETSGRLVINMKGNIDVIDKIKKNEKIISINRKYISPMFVTEENLIEI